MSAGEREGPRSVNFCHGCRHYRSTPYRVQGDSGYDRHCLAIDRALPESYGDQRTPKWCPYLATAERAPASSGEGAPHPDGTLYDYDAGWDAAERGRPRDDSKPCAWLNGWGYWHAIEERDRLAAQLREAQAATRRECAADLRIILNEWRARIANNYWPDIIIEAAQDIRVVLERWGHPTPAEPAASESRSSDGE